MPILCIFFFLWEYVVNRVHDPHLNFSVQFVDKFIRISKYTFIIINEFLNAILLGIWFSVFCFVFSTEIIYIFYILVIEGFVLCLGDKSVIVIQAAVLTTTRGYALACRQPHSVFLHSLSMAIPSTYGLLTAPLLPWG